MVGSVLDRPRGQWWPKRRIGRETSSTHGRRISSFWRRGEFLRLLCMLWLVCLALASGRTRGFGIPSSSSHGSSSRSNSFDWSTPSMQMEASTSLSSDSDEVEARKGRPVFPGKISELRKDPPGLFEQVNEEGEESTGEEGGQPKPERIFKDYNSQELDELASDIIEACKPLVEEANEHERKIRPDIDAWEREKAALIVDNMPSDEYPCPHELADSSDERAIAAMGDDYLDDPDYKEWDADGLGWKSACCPQEEREVMDGPRGGGGTEADSGGDRVMKEEVGDAEIKQHQHVGEVPPPPLRGASSSSRVSMPPREGEDEGFDRGDDSAPSGS